MSRGLLSPANLEEPTNILVTGYLEEGGVFVEEPELHLELLRH